MADKKKIYWDACLFFEWLGDEEVENSLKGGLTEILDENDDGKNIIVTSVITDLEVVPDKLESKNIGALERYNSLFDGVTFHQLEINKNILRLAKEIRNYYFKPADEDGHGGKMMDIGDAIHLATAIISKVDEFHTRDASAKGSKIPLLTLYEFSGNNRVCGIYELKILSPIANQGVLDI